MGRSSIFLVLLLFAGSTLGAEHVIHAGRLVDVDAGKVLENMSVITSDEQIVAVQEGFVQAESGQKLIDLSQHVVLPGLMDMHTHITNVITPEFYSEQYTLGPADWALRATVYTEDTLMAGFTTIRDLGDQNDGGSIALRNAISAGYITGPRIYTASRGIQTTGGHFDPTNGLRRGLLDEPGPEQGVINGPEDARKVVRLRYKEGADLIKIAATGGVLSLAKSGDIPQFQDDELAAIVATARDYQFSVAVHAHGLEGIKRAIQAGVDSIEHGTYLDDEAIRLMKERGTYLVPTISAGKWVTKMAEKDDYYPDIIRPKARTIGPLMQENFSRAYKDGVRIAFGSDAGVFPHGLNAMEFGFMVEAGMPPMEAIQAATVHAARLLRVEAELGQIKPGFLADIIAVSSDPMQDITSLKEVVFVMKDGIVYKHKK